MSAKLPLALALCAALATAQTHRFACTGYTQGTVFLVDRSGKVERSYDARTRTTSGCFPMETCCFNTGQGVKEVTRESGLLDDGLLPQAAEPQL